MYAKLYGVIVFINVRTCYHNTRCHGVTSDDHSETVRCLSVTKVSCQFWGGLSVVLAGSLARWPCSALVRSGLASARNKPVVGRYLFRSVFPFTLILLCPLGATQSRPAMCAGSLPACLSLDLQKMAAALCDVMKCCRGFTLQLTFLS